MTENSEQIAVIGLGYIGLPTAAMLASRGARVLGVDVKEDVVATVNRGEIHIVEPGLAEVVSQTVSSGALRASTAPEASQAFLIAVPTPFKGPDHEPDLRFVEQAARSIAKVLKQGDIVILESTSPVGATEQMAGWLAEERPDLSFPQDADNDADINIAYCPERVLPGKVMQELIENDRVIGGMTARCSERAARLYGRFVTGTCIRASSPRVAEMCKLTENSFRDVNIAFANELSIICDRLGIDVWELIELANRHPRVNVLQPGPGVGGHCIACDPWFIVSSAPEEARLIRTARNVNDDKPGWVMRKVEEALRDLSEQTGQPQENLTLACYGLAFKPDIDDLRDSPSLAIARQLAGSHNGTVKLIEPNIEELPSGLEGASLTDTEDAADADLHLLLVDHGEFKAMPCPRGHVLDMRGIWRQTCE